MPDNVAPPPALAAVIDAFWQHTGTGSELRVLPDGCMDFLFDLERGTGRVIGAMTEAALVPMAAGERYFGVRFLPGAAAQFVTARASELVDVDAPLDDLTFAARERLAERVAEARGPVERRRLVALYLSSPAHRVRPIERRVRGALVFLRGATGSGTVRETARHVGLGERQLERLFTAEVGIGPKTFARVARLERALGLMGGTRRGQADLAVAAGYADESHLIREFRALAHATPVELARELDVGFVQAE
jgi:AraC-like DNA-binding protein